MFEWLVFGRLLRGSTHAYIQGEYLLATSMIDQALRINSKDFIANFMRLRLAIVQKDIECAELYIAQCKEINPKAAAILIPPWQEALTSIVQGKTLDSSYLQELKMEAQIELKKLQDDRKITLFDPIIVFLVIFLISIILKIFLGPSGEIRFNILDILSAILLLFYYNYKSNLHLNVYIRLCEFFDNMLIILRSPYYLLIIAIVTFLKMKAPLLGVEAIGPSFLNVFATLMAQPIGTQLFYCGLVFLPLNKYNRALAYVITAICFGVGSETFVGASLVSFFYTYTFDRFKTIAAPICLDFSVHFLGVLMKVNW